MTSSRALLFEVLGYLVVVKFAPFRRGRVTGERRPPRTWAVHSEEVLGAERPAAETSAVAIYAEYDVARVPSTGAAHLERLNNTAVAAHQLSSWTNHVLLLSGVRFSHRSLPLNPLRVRLMRQLTGIVYVMLLNKSGCKLISLDL